MTLLLAFDFLSEQARAELETFINERIEERLAGIPTGSPWLSIAEGAEYLRLSPSMLRKLITQGRVKAHGAGRRRLVHRDDLDHFVKSGGRGGSANRTPTRRSSLP